LSHAAFGGAQPPHPLSTNLAQAAAAAAAAKEEFRNNENGKYV